MSTHIYVRLPATTAVTIGSGNAGLHLVPFTAADLAACTPREREALAEHASDGADREEAEALEIDDEPTAAGVLSSLRRDLAHADEERGRELLEREKQIAKLLELPDAEWLQSAQGGQAVLYTLDRSGYALDTGIVGRGSPSLTKWRIPTDAHDDPRIVELVARLERDVLAPAKAEWTAELARYEAWCVTKRENLALEAKLKQALYDAAERSLRDYALTVPELMPATREGYSVIGAAWHALTNGLRLHVAQKLRSGSDDPEPRTEWLSAGAEAEERSAPLPRAVETQQQLVKLVDRYELPAGVTASVSRVSRVELEGEKTTAVVVTVRCVDLGRESQFAIVTE